MPVSTIEMLRTGFVTYPRVRLCRVVHLTASRRFRQCDYFLIPWERDARSTCYWHSHAAPALQRCIHCGDANKMPRLQQGRKGTVPPILPIASPPQPTPAVLLSNISVK